MLVKAADQLNVGLAGGGAFQQWSDRQIYDAPRFQYISELYGYLAKQFTVFGQHVHIGCPDPDSALFLLHSMSRFIPHFIALSASSPFVQNVDTGFHSARLNSVFAFPLSGRAPFADLGQLRGVLHEDGEHRRRQLDEGLLLGHPAEARLRTIEVRVMDTPLSVDRAAAIACYIQTLARYLLTDRPLKLSEDDYLCARSTVSRRAASLEGTCVNPQTGERRTIAEDILDTLDRIAPHAAALGSRAALDEIGARQRA